MFSPFSISDVLLSLHLFVFLLLALHAAPDIEILAFRIVAWVFRVFSISMFFFFGFT